MAGPATRAERQLGAMRTKVSALITQLQLCEATLDEYVNALEIIAGYDSEPVAQREAQAALTSGTKGGRS